MKINEVSKLLHLLLNVHLTLRGQFILFDHVCSFGGVTVKKHLSGQVSVPSGVAWATKVMIITFFCFPASITLSTACGGITITVSQNHVKPGHLDFHSYMFLLIIQILFN